MRAIKIYPRPELGYTDEWLWKLKLDHYSFEAITTYELYVRAEKQATAVELARAALRAKVETADTRGVWSKVFEVYMRSYLRWKFAGYELTHFDT